MLFSVAVAVSTCLGVIHYHISVVIYMSLFQGHVPCQNFTLTGHMFLLLRPFKANRSVPEATLFKIESFKSTNFCDIFFINLFTALRLFKHH